MPRLALFLVLVVVLGACGIKLVRWFVVAWHGMARRSISVGEIRQASRSKSSQAVGPNVSGLREREAIHPPWSHRRVPHTKCHSGHASESAATYIQRIWALAVAAAGGAGPLVSTA
jgi:hypothetical protein